MPRDRPNWEAANRRDTVRERGAEPAHLDTDNLMPEERRELRRRPQRDEEQRVNDLRAELNRLVSGFKWLSIDSRDRVYANHVEEIHRRADETSGALSAGGQLRFGSEINEIRQFAIKDLGPPARTKTKARRRR